MFCSFCSKTQEVHVRSMGNCNFTSALNAPTYVGTRVTSLGGGVI